MTDAVIHRSDKIRQRRTEEGATRTQRIARGAKAPAAVPHTTSRASGLGNPILKRASTQPRRKYYVALTDTRELAIPALPVFRTGWRLLSGFVVLGMVILMALLAAGPLFQVKQPVISGLAQINKADVEAILDLNKQSIIFVNPVALKEKLLSRFPDLETVNIQVSLPASVKITLRERHPVIAWKVKDTTYLIDGSGTIFPMRSEISGLLVVTSDDLPPMITTGEPDKLQTTGVKPAVVDPLYNAQIRSKADMTLIYAASALATQMPSKSTMVYSRMNGLGWTDERGWKVYFGIDLKDISTKFGLYQGIVDQLLQRKIKPTVISVEQTDAPFYRVER